MKQRVLLKGKDALDLLHRISTVNLKNAPLGLKQEGLILNPQGKILSFFKITLQSDSDALVEFQDDFLTLVDQYTFSEKYEIESLPLLPETGISEKNRILNLSPKQGFEFESDGSVNPLEINLRAVVHDQKGCYPGQEVIEKIISLGSPAKRLCLLVAAPNVQLSCPQVLKNLEGAEAGTLTSFEEGVALAILKRPYAIESKELIAVDQNQENAVLTVQKVSS
ncbi:MAG: hypothetical protein H7333_02465 [Bdellovibrionales bacterium]|nr:hypothetical protein [Oligoflexia bacterium]